MFCPHRSSASSAAAAIAALAAIARARVGRACFASFSGSAKLSRASPAGFAKSALPGSSSTGGGKSGGGKTRRAGVRRKAKLQEKLSGEVTQRLRRRAARKEFETQEENEALGRTPAGPGSGASAAATEPLSDFVRQLEADNVHQPHDAGGGTAAPLRLGSASASESDPSPSSSTARKTKRLSSAQIRAGAALPADKLSGVATDPEHIDFYNAMEFEVRARLHGRLPRGDDDADAAAAADQTAGRSPYEVPLVGCKSNISHSQCHHQWWNIFHDHSVFAPTNKRRLWSNVFGEQCSTSNLNASFLRRLFSCMISASQSDAANIAAANSDAFDDADVDQGYDADPAAATTTALARLSPALIKSGMSVESKKFSRHVNDWYFQSSRICDHT
jgi:hypothetical protein